LFDSITGTTSNLDSLELVLCIDEDDTESRQITHPLLSIRKIIAPRGTTGMGDIFKLCYDKNTSRYMALINDDVVFRTKNWDIKVLDAFSRFPDDMAIVYPNDLYYGKKLSSFPVISKVMCDLISEICPCSYKSHGIDSHLFDIFDRLAALGYERRKYLPNVIFEHMHYGVTLASYSENFYPDHSEDQSLYSSLAESRQQTAIKMARHIQLHVEKKKPVPPSIAVIMCVSGNLSKSAIACLEVVHEDNKYRHLNYEIIILSDSMLNEKAISSLPRDLKRKIKLVCRGKNDTAGVLQREIAASNADSLVFLDDHCLPRSGWLQALADVADDDRVAVVGSKWINPRNGRVEHVGLSFFQDSGGPRETCLYKGFPLNHPAVNKVREFQAVRMPGMLIKKKAFLQIDGGTEVATESGSLDLCLKIRRLGNRILYAPQASLYYDYQEIPEQAEMKKALPNLNGAVECDLEKQLAEDGFLLCSTSQGHYSITELGK
jgi:hypothetical protein